MNSWAKNEDIAKRQARNKMTFFLTLHMLAGGLYILVFRPDNMQDINYWVYRIGALADEMRTRGILHALPPRILSTTFNGYGYGAPLFYCDVFLWFPAVLVVHGVSEFTSYTILCAAIWGARVAVAIFSASLILKRYHDIEDKFELSLLFAFSYSCFPYMIEVLLVRGAIGESIASIFFPLIAATLYRMVYEENKSPQNVVLMALSLFGVVCSHNISSIIVACCAIVYIIWHWKRFWAERWRLAELIKAGTLATGLAAFWLFPFLEQYVTHIIPDMSGWWWHNTVSLSDWFLSYSFTRGGLTWSPSTFGIPLVVWTILSLVHKKTRRNKYIGIMLLLSWLLCIFMTSRTAMEVTEVLIGFMQFAWRLLSVVSLLLSIVVGVIYCMTSGKRAVFITVYLIYIACFFLSDSVWFGKALIMDAHIIYGKNNADDLYIPQGAFPGMYDLRGELVDTNLSELQFEYERLPKAEFRLKYWKNTGNAVLQLPIFYYKGYEAYDLVNQRKLSIEKGDIGLIWVHLDQDESGEVVVSYVGTPIQRVSDAVSLVTWMVLAVYLLVSICRNRRNCKILRQVGTFFQ
ncbi:MAG: glucosyltransferase domain-containing protein [Lachnospiraceae bacterium]|nr:glucosyltransferase domain-containing protein [Lachnospiraceae bacterium]